MSGYRPGENLFFSYESGEHKFTSIDADALVDGMFDCGLF